jgi:hypothetical protein
MPDRGVLNPVGWSPHSACTPINSAYPMTPIEDCGRWRFQLSFLQVLVTRKGHVCVDQRCRRQTGDPELCAEDNCHSVTGGLPTFSLEVPEPAVPR